MTPFSLFVIDDEDVARKGISLALRKQEYRVSGFADAEQALESLKDQTPDLILLDVGLPGMSGIEALEKIKQMHPDILVIMITAFEDVQTIVSAMKMGAYDYFVKPLDMNGLLITVRNALETIALKKENRLLQEKYVSQNLPHIIGESAAIKEILNKARQVAKSSDTPVLLYGETGTGKELIAQTIHYLSPNYKGNLVSVNCAAIPKELIESELFGYEKGAFSGADKSGKVGLVEKAADGTLFLDEVGDMGSEAQAKLLRFLESGEYFRVGGSKSRHVKTRVVSATNKDLSALVEQGLFRNDLYFRLAVVKFDIPPLSQRPDDVLALSRFFLNYFNNKFSKSYHGFSPEAEAALIQRQWTGNVRELKNLLERAVLFGDGGILDSEDLGLNESAKADTDREAMASSSQLPALSAEGIDLPRLIKQIEDSFFDQALALCQGNVSGAAKLLHMSRDQFRYRVQKSQS